MSEGPVTGDGAPDATSVDESVRAPGRSPKRVEDNGGGKLSAKAQRKLQRHLPGEEGTWIFIFGDMTVFALLFGVYIEARSHDPELFDLSQQALNQNFGAINTLLLLSSSLLVVTAIRAMRSDRVRNLAPALVAGAFACGLGFCLIKYLEYSDKLSHGIKPATNDFWMYFYVLTGLHFFHLLIGMALLAFIFVQARRPKQIDARRFAFVEGSACFWHMVDLLWIVLFPLLYLVH